LLRYSWHLDTEVCFELSEADGKVRLVVTHRRLSSKPLMIAVAAGWHTHLSILAARLQDRDPPSFWPTHLALERDYAEKLAHLAAD
jgi:hypothetical protein